MRPKLKEAIEEHEAAINSVKEIAETIEEISGKIVNAVQKGACIYWLGNGGSAADAQHYAAELMVRYAKNRKPIPSIALTTDTSLITAHSNDFEYDTVFERQVEALVTEKDIVVGISTSGNSRNVELALKKSIDKGALTVAMLGKDGGEIGKFVKNSIIIKSDITAHIQEAHLVIGHFICNLIESEIRESF